jgi:hypothetical protein
MNLPKQPMCDDMFPMSQISEIIVLICPSSMSWSDMMAFEERTYWFPFFFKVFFRVYEVVVNRSIDTHAAYFRLSDYCRVLGCVNIVKDIVSIYKIQFVSWVMSDTLKEKIKNICFEYGLDIPFDDDGYFKMKKRLIAIGLLKESDDQ